MNKIIFEKLKKGDKITWINPQKDLVNFEVVTSYDEYNDGVQIKGVSVRITQFLSRVVALRNELFYTDTATQTPKVETKLSTCNHNNKYKNHAGGTMFWFCPSCKNDLGNV